MQQIIIQIGPCTIHANLRDTPTAKQIYAALPFESVAQTWGDEVYFTVPVDSELEANAKDVVEKGEIAFWVEGSCIAIGFGPTPISTGHEIRLAAKTNIWADAVEDVGILKEVNSGQTIHVAKAT